MPARLALVPVCSSLKMKAVYEDFQLGQRFACVYAASTGTSNATGRILRRSL
jgi:hypothetical protein